MGGDQYAAAREIFNKYDGSSFYMSRDDMESRYRDFGVPKEVENQWLSELSAQKLALFDQAPNGGIIHFFWHHADVRHLQRFVEAEPVGDYTARRVYMWDLFNYTKICVPCYSSWAIEQALNRSVQLGESLAAEADDEQSRAQMNKVVSTVRSYSQEVTSGHNPNDFNRAGT